MAPFVNDTWVGEVKEPHRRPRIVALIYNPRVRPERNFLDPHAGSNKEPRT